MCRRALCSNESKTKPSRWSITAAKEQQIHLNVIYINVFNFRNLPLGCNFYRFINDYTYLFHFISISRIPAFLIFCAVIRLAWQSDSVVPILCVLVCWCDVFSGRIIDLETYVTCITNYEPFKYISSHSFNFNKMWRAFMFAAYLCMLHCIAAEREREIERSMRVWESARDH